MILSTRFPRSSCISLFGSSTFSAFLRNADFRHFGGIRKTSFKRTEWHSAANLFGVLNVFGLFAFFLVLSISSFYRIRSRLLGLPGFAPVLGGGISARLLLSIPQFQPSAISIPDRYLRNVAPSYDEANFFRPSATPMRCRFISVTSSMRFGF